MVTLLLHLGDIDEAPWMARFSATLPGVRLVTRHDRVDPAGVDYILAWKPSADAFAGLTGLKAILSIGAGVDGLLRHPYLPEGIPIVRFVDDNLSQRMSEYVVAQVMMHHRLFTRYKRDQKARRWSQHYPPAASETSVGIMGLGQLGRDAAGRLARLGFNLSGWSLSRKAFAGISEFAGPDALDEFLAGTDILVCLLPLTARTQGILNYANFRKLRRDRLDGGPVVINAARGGHQVEADLVKALTDETLAAASLDVFEHEPLPADSPLWDLENCYITPHIAGISSPQAGANYFARIIAAHESGAPLINVVDRQKGY